MKQNQRGPTFTAAPGQRMHVLGPCPGRPHPVHQNIPISTFQRNADLPGKSAWSKRLSNQEAYDHMMGFEAGTHFVIMGTTNKAKADLPSRLFYFLVRGKSDNVVQGHYSNAVVLNGNDGTKKAFHIDAWQGNSSLLQKKLFDTTRTETDPGGLWWREPCKVSSGMNPAVVDTLILDTVA
jgi:hypothetical protein